MAVRDVIPGAGGPSTDWVPPRAPGAVGQGDGADSLTPLLRAYADALDVAAGHVPATSGRRAVARMLGAERFTAAHVRRGVDLLARRQSRRVGLVGDDSDEIRDLERLERFAASLPAPRPFRPLLPILAIWIVAQVLTPVAELVNRQADELMKSFEGLTSPSLQSFARTVDDVSRADVMAAVVACWVLTLSVWIVLRPFVVGHRRHRTILGLDGGRRLLMRTAPVQGVSARRREEAAFGDRGLPAPPESGFDLWVKASAAVALGLMGVDALYLRGVEEQLRDVRLWTGLGLLVFAALRLGWLLAEGQRRRRRTTAWRASA